ncbi:phosphoribosylglycinamide formyltransferase [Rubrobacter aplysinae]|uniref:phosphoribosylglycinamide formyltransferase n=1 Tax=Rubrobacter aplysinae TaxID=909625 RepID=UPI00064BFF63|nr:phosphoribosylglycinamide formyltransferase [Rubrobacter aplysinae]
MSDFSDRSDARGLRLPEGCRIAVLASGGGTNLQALVDAYPEEVAVVAGDRAGAYAFERARTAGIPVEHVAPDGSGNREGYDSELADRLARYDVSLVVGAGYMRLLSGKFLARFPATINVHPSMLPEFKGLGAVERVLEAGVPQTGVTVHYVTEEVDSGPVILQEGLSVRPDDTLESLMERIRPVEHRLLVEAVRMHFRERLTDGPPG